jgi:hypothetical protein
MERASALQELAYSVVGAPDAIQRGLEGFIAETDADELMLTAQIYDHAAGSAPLKSPPTCMTASSRDAARHDG